MAVPTRVMRAVGLVPVRLDTPVGGDIMMHSRRMLGSPRWLRSSQATRRSGAQSPRGQVDYPLGRVLWICGTDRVGRSRGPEAVQIFTCPLVEYEAPAVSTLLGVK